MAKNPGGAPRQYDYDELTRKLYEWSGLDDSMNLCHFCTIYLDPPISPSQFCQMKDRDDELCKAYEIARARLGARREAKLSKGHLHVKAYDLNASTYDYFMVQRNRKEKTFDHELKKKEIEHEGYHCSDIKAESERLQKSKK